ncbi:hypothetical protein LXL04_028928 [Taraxacum kok-saghyz]
MAHKSRSFENSYIPENPRTPKPLTFSKNRLRGAKNRSNISPVAKKISEKTTFFFPKTLHMCKLFFCAYVHSFLSLYNTYLKRFVKKNLKKNAKKKKSCTYAQKIKKSCTYAKRIVMIKNVLEGSEVVGYPRDASATVLFDEWFRFGKPSDRYPHNVALTTYFRLMVSSPKTRIRVRRYGLGYVGFGGMTPPFKPTNKQIGKVGILTHHIRIQAINCIKTISVLSNNNADVGIQRHETFPEIDKIFRKSSEMEEHDSLEKLHLPLMKENQSEET